MIRVVGSQFFRIEPGSALAMPPKVSLSMIVKNGAETLERCLASVSALVDEMIVIDTGSTDGSKAIAEAAGAVVHDFEWTDSFADARNASLDHCQGSWIFWLDADEWLDPANQGRFKALIDQLPDRNTAYLMNQVSQQADAQELAVSQARLFRNAPGLRWRYRVHEQISPCCNALGFRQARAPIAIQHSGYASEALSRSKEERNRRLLRIENAENPGDTWVLYQLGKIQARDHPDEARLILRAALEKTKAGDALRRRIHSLLVEIDMTQGKAGDALANVQNALKEIPNDTNLLSHAGRLAFEAGDLTRAERHFTTLMETKPDAEEYLHALDLSLRGWQTRHNLAVVFHNQGRLRDAERLWKENASEKTAATFSWLGLAGIFQREQRWDDLNAAIAHLENANDAASLQVRSQAHLALKQFDQARATIAAWIDLEPRNVLPRLLLSRAFIHEATDLDAAEAALLAVLELDNENHEGLHNLEAVRKYREELANVSSDR